MLDHLNKATTRRLNVYEPDGKKITYSSFPNSSSYLFSFDGKKILLFFWSGGGYRLADSALGGFYKDIYTLGRGISYEDESMFEALRSSLSPDSKKIAFLTRIPNCTNRFVINVVNVDGSNRKKIVEGNNYSWSPSSQRIIFDNFKDSKIGHIYSVNVNRGGTPDYLFEGSCPSYSPDGKKIAFYNQGVYIAEVKWNRVVNLLQLSNAIINNTIQWSPDSAKIIYQSEITKKKKN